MDLRTCQKDSGEAERSQIVLQSRGLRERKKRLRLQRIITVSRNLFIRQRFRTLLFRIIAEEAALGLGRYICTLRAKEDLLVLVFARHLLPMTEFSL